VKVLIFHRKKNPVIGPPYQNLLREYFWSVSLGFDACLPRF
jgi:hypothetical protein